MSTAKIVGLVVFGLLAGLSAQFIGIVTGLGWAAAFAILYSAPDTKAKP